MTDMVERVARAIYDSAGSSPTGQPSWDQEDSEMHEWIKCHARAAIEAMREPTDLMWGRGAFAMERYPNGPLETWRAMIDAALGGPPVAS